MPRPHRRPPGRHTVAAVAFPQITPFELAVACEVFGLDRSDLVDPWYDFFVASTEPGAIPTSAGFDLCTPHGLRDLARADTIVVPANHPDPGPPGELLDALRAAHDRGARLLSFCTGAFVLAAAGLLDGRRATTHWMWAAELAEAYPLIDVDPNVLYVDEGNVLTSAGTAAGIDLCLHVVRMDHGAEVANMVARRMVVPPHRDGGQAQFVDHPVPKPDTGDSLARTLEWMTANLGKSFTIDDLAARAHMSPRTFARRFRSTTGTTPHQWLITQRLLLAQRLLESTDLPIERIAEEAGFGTAANLRHHFQRDVTVSPQAYRRTFRQRAG